MTQQSRAHTVFILPALFQQSPETALTNLLEQKTYVQILSN